MHTHTQRQRPQLRIYIYRFNMQCAQSNNSLRLTPCWMSVSKCKTAVSDLQQKLSRNEIKMCDSHTRITHRSTLAHQSKPGNIAYIQKQHTRQSQTRKIKYEKNAADYWKIWNLKIKLNKRQSESETEKGRSATKRSHRWTLTLLTHDTLQDRRL